MPESYIGDEGDEALDAGLDIMDGGEDWAGTNGGWRAINKTRDMVAAVLTAFTGHTHTRSQITDLPALSTGATGNTTMARDANGRSEVVSPITGTNIANKSYVDGLIAAGSAADGPSSAAYARNAVGSGWFVVYMNSALQFMRNTSSRRYKKNIRDWAGSSLGLRTVMFDRRGEDTPVINEVGFIAEEVLESLPEAVVYFDGEIDGINDRAILAAAVADIQRLHLRIAALEQAS